MTGQDRGEDLGGAGRGWAHREVETGRGMTVRAGGVRLSVGVWSSVRRVCGAALGSRAVRAPYVARDMRFLHTG
ncbi:hypothetical protein ACH5AU_16820, partial [Streptomyces albidoflavus]